MDYFVLLQNVFKSLQHFLAYRHYSLLLGWKTLLHCYFTHSCCVEGKACFVTCMQCKPVGIFMNILICSLFLFQIFFSYGGFSFVCLQRLGYDGVSSLLGMAHTVGTVPDGLPPPRSILIASSMRSHHPDVSFRIQLIIIPSTNSFIVPNRSEE